jgi:hypothetical protein
MAGYAADVEACFLFAFCFGFEQEILPVVKV